MYLGKIVELADSESLFETPLHPYTQALLSAVPVPGGGPRKRIALSGEVANPADPPPGCPFHPRCPHPAVDASCRTATPVLEPRPGGSAAACHKA